MSDGQHGEVQITCGSVEEAAAIARALVEARLAACVSAVSIASVYEWDGALTEGDEVLLLAKTRVELFDAVAEFVREVHSYELPAITMVPLSGTPEYLAWIDVQVGGRDAGSAP
jgi:periplasmic divalent cation tolerance protein